MKLADIKEGLKTIKWFSFWKMVLYFVLAAGLYATVYRFVKGLGPSTHLSDDFPWGIWIGFDVLCGVMLAAGGFTLTGAVHIFNIKRLHPIVRPTVLTAFLGYVLVCVALMFDLGRPYNIWHPLIMWNPHSVMFEVGWCVMLYTTVLALEFAPVVLERFKLEKPLRIIRGISVPIVIAGVILSTLHQSSLGSVYLIVPTKLHPFWYTPLLPGFFFLSAVVVGLAMTIFESSMSAKHFGRQLELHILKDLGRALLVVLIVYSVLRFEDLLHRGVLKMVLQPGYERNLFLLEITLALVIPIILLFFKRVRESAGGLYLVSVTTLLGFVTNRLNVAVTGMEASAGVRYIPKWTEIAVTAAIVGAGFAIFGLIAKYLPIFTDEHQHETRPTRVAAPAKVAVMSNAD